MQVIRALAGDDPARLPMNR